MASTLLSTAAVAAAGLAYSAGYEVRAFRIRHVTVPILPPGQPSLRVLQITDLHMTPGQLRVPVYGALVSNCDLDPRRARGLSRHSEGTLLHVSAGLGTSPYAPVRFACPPEANLLTLVARD